MRIRVSALVILFSLCLSATNPAEPSGPQSETADPPTWSLAATGDSIITRPVSIYDDERLLDLVELVRGADIAFTNVETTILRLWDFKGWPAAGAWEQRGPPEMADELKWMGFDLANFANNHTGDFGIEGMVATMRNLERAGLVHSGAGMNLGRASAPAYLDTKKGRVALIGLASTFARHARAAPTRLDSRGRPGLNPLRINRTYQVDPERMADLRRIGQELGSAVPESPEEPLRVGGTTFVQGTETKLIETVNPQDEERILHVIRNAAKQADFVIVNSHSHESGNTNEEPPPWLIGFIKKCLDAGAVTYIVHGPHRLRGIEIYKGKPIFYSLADFIFQYETEEPVSQDTYELFDVVDPNAMVSAVYDPEGQKGEYAMLPENAVWFESVVAIPVFKGHRMVELKLHPIEMGHKDALWHGDGRTTRGTPRLAKGELAKEIIDLVVRLSAPFGTNFVFEDGIGVWQP